jgi:uncharacterized protein YecE (DUF72 family)
MSKIRVGIGGWNFAPWRNNFYPPGLAHAKELGFASRKVTAIEINATFYRTQSPQTYRRWAEETPDDFIFSLKAHRLTTHRKILAEAGPSIEHFLSSGVLELKEKLGPIVWQFAPTKKFEPEDFEAFLSALPSQMNGQKLRHVAEVRHDSFCTPAFIALLRHHQVAVCVAHSRKYPLIADPTADFIYVRLQESTDQETGYEPRALDQWARRAVIWAAGDVPDDLPLISDVPAEKLPSRDCFIYFIAGAKERNPAAACALIERLEIE